jgi:hypothetical protein
VTNTVTPSSPFDPNGSLPAVSMNIGGPPVTPSVTGVSTSNANDIILQFCGAVDVNSLWQCQIFPSAGWIGAVAQSAFTNSFVNYQLGNGVYYQTVAATLSAATVSGVEATAGPPSTVITNWINFADAIECGTSPPPPSGAIPHVWVNE